ncbi:MAG: 8-oxoguanine deaminase [Phycisphaerae bacterium]
MSELHCQPMRTRIEHATIITCQENNPVVLPDHSVEFRDGVITRVGRADQMAEGNGRLTEQALAELKGRPLGTILLATGKVTQEQIQEALRIQAESHGVIGQELLHLGYVGEADIEHALAIQCGDISQAGTARACDLTIIDGRDCLVIPGLINTHHHLFQSLTRCAPHVQNACLFEWLVGLYPHWQHLTYEALHQAALISIAELILNGCTTTSDHMYLFPPASDVAAEAVLRAAETLGIRIHFCRGSMTLGRSAGGLPPEECVETDERVLADSVRVIDLYHDPSPLAMRRIDLAPCAPFNITPELLDQTRDLAAERAVLLHTHIAETLDEERYCLERFGVRPLEYLRQHRWLGSNVYLAHCIHVNEAEIRLLAETSTGVVHCPCSNMRLGSGIAPIRKMLDAGIKVGLAVDGGSSNDSGNLLAEARQALLLQRVVNGAGALRPADAFRLVTTGGAAVLGRPKLGRIEPGCAADLVLYDATDIAMAGGVAQDPLGALILCQPCRPKRVIVAGRTLAQDGHLAGIDQAGLAADFNQLVRAQFTNG